MTEEQIVRLLTGVLGLLRQHQVNKQGQCRFCGWTRWRWRWWRRRPQCTVYRAFDFAMGQPPDIVWWQLVKSMGRTSTLDEVREWLTQRAPAARGIGDREFECDDPVVWRRMAE